jgi:ribosomal protein S2
MKLKIEKARLVETVGTKRTIFDKLVAVMESHVNKIVEGRYLPGVLEWLL